MAKPLFQPGDIFACHGVDLPSRIIQAATFSPFSPPGLRIPPSHVAIAAFSPNGGLALYESTMFCPSPCLMRGAKVAGAQCQEIGERIADYQADGGRVDIYRLSPFWRLSQRRSDQLTDALADFVRNETSYDLRGALLSGTRCYQLSRLFPAAALESVFCSEMIAAALQKVGYLDTDINASRMNPARLLRRLVAAGKYRRVRSYHQNHVELH